MCEKHGCCGCVAEERDRLRVRVGVAEARAGKLDQETRDMYHELVSTSDYAARLRNVMEAAWRRLDSGDAYGADATGVMIALQEALEEPLSRAGRLAQAKDKVVEAAGEARRLAGSPGWNMAWGGIMEALRELDRVQKEGEDDP